MANTRTVTFDIDPRQHDLTLDNLHQLADMLDLSNRPSQGGLTDDPITVASRLRDLADRLGSYVDVAVRS